MGDYEIIIKEIDLSYSKKLIHRSNKVVVEIVDKDGSNDFQRMEVRQHEIAPLIKALQYSLENWALED